MKYLFPILVIICLTAATVVRLYKIDNPVADWHEFRQADTAAVSRYYLQNGIDLLHPRYEDLSNIQSGKDNPSGYRFVEFPLYNAAHAILAQATGLPIEKSGRVLSVVLSLIGLVGLWKLAKMFWGDKTAILVLAFASLNPYWIYYSRVILPEPLMIAAGIWSLIFFARYLQDKGLINAILGGVLFGLAILVKPFIGFWFLGLPLILFIRKDFRKILVLAVITSFSLIPLALWRLWSLKFPEGIPAYDWLFNSDGIRFRPAFFRWLFYERLVKLILGGWGIAAFCLGLAKKLVKDDLLAVGMIAGSVIYLFVVATGNVRHDYYQILVFPPLALFVGRGLSELVWGKWVGNTTGVLTAIIIFSASIAFGWYKVGGYYQINHPEIILAGKAVDLLTPQSAKVIAPYNGDTAFLYYTNRQGWPLGYDIDKKISQGASYYVSVNFDQETKDLAKKYPVIKQTPTYIIIKLAK